MKPVSLLTVLLLCACRGSSLPEPPGISQHASLSAATSCEQLRSAIADAAVVEMKMTLESEKQGGWAWPVGGGVLAGGPGQGGSNSPAPQAPTATTGTNNQVAGADEADFVKSDGTRLLVLSGQKLYLSKSWPPQNLTLSSSVAIEGWPGSMLLDAKSRATVISTVPDVWTGPPLGRPCGPGFGCFFGGGTTKITVVDAGDLANPRVLAEHWLPGRAGQARLIGGVVRVVLTDPMRWPQDVRFWPQDPNAWKDKDALAAALDALARDDERIIRAAPLEAWLPPPRHKLADGTVADVPYRCTDFWLPSAPTRLGIATVATLDNDSGSAPALASIIGSADRVYATASTLYLAEQHFWWWPRPGQKDFTYLHAFDISDPAGARYLASGGVEGHLNDQFSMDEFAGAFRVATTIATRVKDDKNPWGRLELSNKLSVLARSGDRLKLVGDSGEFQKGEAIRSARFLGDRGFVVTFKNIDPLLAFDLSDVKMPRLVGQLTVPGFSSYLHPMDPDHLIALGVDIPDPDASGHIPLGDRHMKLALYDVSNLREPRQLAVQLVGTAHGWSEAASDHHAFNYFAGRKLLAIPFSDWVGTGAGGKDPWGSFVSDLRLFRVDASAGFAPLGALDLRDLFTSSGDANFPPWFSAWVRRSVISTDDAGNEFVYAVSDAGARVAKVGALDVPLASEAFPRQPFVK